MRFHPKSYVLPTDEQTFWLDVATPLQNLDFDNLMVGQSVAKRYRFTDETMPHGTWALRHQLLKVLP